MLQKMNKMMISNWLLFAVFQFAFSINYFYFQSHFSMMSISIASPVSPLLVRFPTCQDQYFNVGSIPPDEGTSKPPGYPTHEKSRDNIRVQ